MGPRGTSTGAPAGASRRAAPGRRRGSEQPEGHRDHEHGRDRGVQAGRERRAQAAREEPDPEASERLGPEQRALLAYTDAMTREIAVPEEIFAELRRHFTERQAVELTMLIGAYNMLTRFLSALKVDPEP